MDNLVAKTLSPLVDGAIWNSVMPVEEQDKPYIVFTITEIPETFGDDRNVDYGFDVNVNIFTKENYKHIKAEAMKLLNDIGIVIDNVAYQYEKDTGLHHVVLQGITDGV